MTRGFTRVVLAASLALCLPLFAQVTEVTPTSGSVLGGTEVTIRGDFENWFGTDIYFGNTPAAESRRVDEHTVVAVTPAHAAGVVEISRWDYDLLVPIGYNFTFVEGPPAGYARVLLPLFTGPVRGQNGSDFRTTLQIANAGNEDTVFIGGLQSPCLIAQCGDRRVWVEPRTELPPFAIDYDGTPGKFLYLPQDQLDSLVMNLNVRDITRSEQNAGTEMPIVRESEFKQGLRAITGVGSSSFHRSTLRIYGEKPFWAIVRVIGQNGSQLVHVAGGDGFLTPAYGALAGGFPDGTITIEPLVDLESGVPSDVRYWAFISLTNNETQMITTVTPRP